MIREFDYVKVSTLKEATDALQSGNAKPLAGGTDLLVDMRNGVSRPDLLVDIKGIEELKTFSMNKGNGIEIGANVTLNTIIEDKKLRELCPVITDSAMSIATYQLRNRATLVGNICNASPAADMAPALYILNALVAAAGVNGERTIPIGEFITGVKKTTLEKGEMVVRVKIPRIPAGKTCFLKKQRIRGHDLATVNMAGLADRESNTLKVCIGACGITPILLEGLDDLYRNIRDRENLAEEVAMIALGAVSPIDDVRASAEYRRGIVYAYTKRLIREITSPN